MICALSNGIQPVAIVDANGRGSFANIPVVESFAAVEGGFDSAVITDLTTPQATYEQAVAAMGEGRVIAPAILGLRLGQGVAA